MDRRTFLKTAAASTGTFVAAEGLNFLPFATQAQIPNASQCPLEVIALTRMAFGPSPWVLDHFQKLGNNPKTRLHAFIEEQTAMDKIDDSICTNRLNEAHFTTLNKSLTQLWADHVVAPEAMKDMEKTAKEEPAKDNSSKANNVKDNGGKDPGKKKEHDLRMEPVNELEQATWIKAVYSRKQLNEVLVGFWHNHFSIFGFEQKISPVFVHYDRDVIRKNAWGNFREMLEGVAKSPAMLLYLDNAVNQSGNPNENYARELFELHTLGAENYLGTMERSKVPNFASGHPKGYVDGDVYESARCFTGWRIDQGKNSKDTGQFEYFDQWHDRFQKIVLGRQLKEYQPPLKDGNDVLDILARHPGTAQFISRKLCRRFVSDTPSQSLVNKAAKVFSDNVNSHDQLKKVVKTILASVDFQDTWGKKVKRPFESVVGMLRATEADFSPSDKFIKTFERTGQRLFQWRSPDGYPDVHEKWTGANSILEKWKLYHQLATNMEGVNIKSVNETDLLTQWPKRSLGRDLNESTRAAISKFLAQGKGPNWQPTALALVFMSPDYQWS